MGKVDAAQANRYPAASNFNSLRGIRVSIRFFSLAATAAIGLTVSAVAGAAQTTPARTAAQAPRPGAPAANAQASQTRAAVLRNLDTAFKTIDKNGNGTLDAAEMSAAEAQVQQRQIAAIRGRFETQFAKADTNKDGSLSKAEFMAAAPSAPRSTNNGATMVGQLDKNKDGRISPDEYRAPMLTRFDSIDSNKDGTITPTERQAAARLAQKR